MLYSPSPLALHVAHLLDKAEPQQLLMLFGTNEVQQCTEMHELLLNCSVIVGMHPDQATEAIVDAALRADRPFAVVPCCVYPTLFPRRRRSPV